MSRRIPSAAARCLAVAQAVINPVKVLEDNCTPVDPIWLYSSKTRSRRPACHKADTLCCSLPAKCRLLWLLLASRAARYRPAAALKQRQSLTAAAFKRLHDKGMV